jgi:outer membrane protein assembly factor BamD
MKAPVRHNGKALLAVLACLLLLSGCLGRKKKAEPDYSASAEPDKVLFDRAMDDIRGGKHAIGRLTLQTLINTYPDSEYLAKAKLAIADSYFKEGGSTGLTQAVAEYKDFITFFPFLDEAPYAQMQVAMAHYRRMEKPDRDRTQARLAEQEFQTFLLKYPEHDLAPLAEQRLREVQEVLAEGDFRIARYYYIKGALKAAGGRLLDLATRYPLYSQSDRALWMLGDIYHRVELDHVAAGFYKKIVQEYPLSPLVEDAKQELARLGVPIPQPNAEALARMQRERDEGRDKPSVFRKSVGMFKSGPDVSSAARAGRPNLEPPSETNPTVEVAPVGGASTGATTGSGGSTVVVETARPGSASPYANPPAAAPESSTAKEGAPAEAKPAAKPGEVKAKSEKDKKAKEKESTSKKKKGLRKIIPW